MDDLRYETRIMGATEEKAEGSEDEHEHGPGNCLTLGELRFVNVASDFFLIRLKIFRGIVEELAQIILGVESVPDVFHQSCDPDEVEHHKGLDEHHIHEGRNSELDVTKLDSYESAGNKDRKNDTCDHEE